MKDRKLRDLKEVRIVGEVAEVAINPPPEVVKILKGLTFMELLDSACAALHLLTILTHGRAGREFNANALSQAASRLAEIAEEALVVIDRGGGVPEQYILLWMIAGDLRQQYIEYGDGVMEELDAAIRERRQEEEAAGAPSVSSHSDLPPGPGGTPRE